MNADTIGPALKDLADRWPTSPFDPTAVATEASNRRRRTRWRAFATVGIIIAVFAGVTATAQHEGQPRPAKPTTSQRNQPPFVSAPAVPPPVRITVVGKRIGWIDGSPVLARVRPSQRATVHAHLSFLHNARGKVHGVALVVARPGTAAGVSPETADSYYRDSRVAISAKTSAISPQQRLLTVTTPVGLAPGDYPVLTVINSDLLSGQHPGIYGPFTMSSELGIIVVTN